MAVSFVQGTYKFQASGSAALAYGSNNTAGNLLVAMNRLFGSSLVMAPPTDSQGNTWVQIDVVTDGASNKFALFYAANCKAGANTVTTGGSGTGIGNELIIMEYSGADLTAPLDQHTTATGTGATGSVGPLTTTFDTEVFVAAFGNITAVLGTLTPGAGYTNRVSAGGAGTLVVEDQSVSSVTTSTATEGFGAGSVSWVGIFATFRGPAAATPSITPPTGGYSTSQTVSITCSTGGSSIFYTTDGTTPTTGSTPYTGPFVVPIPTTVKAMASAAGLNNSTVATSFLGMQSFRLLQKTAYALASAAAPSQTFGSPTTAGSLLIAFVYSTGGIQIGPSAGNPASQGTSITDTAGNTWKQAGVYSITGIGGIWYCESSLGGTPTVTWNLGSVNPAGGTFQIALAEYTGHLASHPLSFAGGIATSNFQPRGGAFTPVLGCLIVNEWGTNGVAATWASPTGVTPQTNTTANVIWGDNTFSLPGDNEMDLNVGASPDTIGSMAVFLPATYVPPNGYSLVRTSMGQDSTLANSAPRFAGGNQGGNLILVAIVTCNSSATDIASVTDTAGNTYSLIASFHGTNQLNDFTSIYAVQNCIDTKLDNTISITYNSTPSASASAIAFEFSGQLRVGTLLDSTANVNNNVNLTTVITAAAAGELLLQIGTRGGGPTNFGSLGANQTDLTYFANKYAGYRTINQGTGITGLNVAEYADFAVSAAGSNILPLGVTAAGSVFVIALNAAPAASTPTFSPVAGSYTGTQHVTISTSSGGATIFYTTDGTTPNHLSTIYTGPVTVSSSRTIKAIAGNGGFSDSPVGSATFSISGGGGDGGGLGGGSFDFHFRF